MFKKYDASHSLSFEECIVNCEDSENKVDKNFECKGLDYNTGTKVCRLFEKVTNIVDNAAKYNAAVCGGCEYL